LDEDDVLEVMLVEYDFFGDEEFLIEEKHA
jgi:hypothetical protein